MEPRILLSADLAPFAVAMMADQNDLTLSHDVETDLIQVHDTFSGDLVAEHLRAETSSVVITGTEGDDRLVMDMAGTYMFPGGMLFDGAGGTDELVGPDVDTTWIVDGVDTGSMEALDFVDVEKLTGGVGNEDLFNLLAGGQSTGGLEGGDGGFDTVAIEAGGLDVVSAPTGPASGTLDVGGLITAYDGFEPVPISGSPNTVFDLGGTGDTFTLSYDAGASSAGTDVFNFDGPGIETHVLSIEAGHTVTINLEGGADTINVSGVEGTLLDGGLTINGGSGIDTFNLGVGHGDLNITGGTGSDVINITDPNAISTIVLGDVINTASSSSGLNSVTVSDLSGFDPVTSTATVTDANSFLGSIDAAFEKAKDMLGQIDDGVEFVAGLPLIGGSSLVGEAQVTVEKVIGIVEALDNVRAQVVQKLEELIDAGTTSANDIEAAIESIAATVTGLGPALVSDKLVLDAELAALGITDAFRITLNAELDGVANSALAINLPTVGILTLSDLVDAVNAQIGANGDYVGKVQAIASNGRIALQVIDAAVTSLSVNATDALATNVAYTLFGYGTALTTLIEGEITERLSGLGDLLFELNNVIFDISASGQFELDFSLEATRSTEFSFDFGAEADALGLSFDSNGRLAVNAGLLLNLELDLDPSGGQFEGKIAALGAGVEIADGSVSVEASVGIIEGTATGSVMLDAGLLAEGSATFDEGTVAFSFAPTVTGYDPSQSGVAQFVAGDESYTVSLSFAVGSDLLGAGFSTSVTISGGNPFTGAAPTITVNPGEFRGLQDFNSFTPGDMVKIVADFILWLEDATESELLSDIDIPFVGGGIEQIANIGAILSNQLLYDVGADGQKDGDDKLVSDLNNAFQAAGLDQYIRAEGTGGGFDIVIIDDKVENIEVITDEGGAMSSIFGWSGTLGDSELGVSGAAFLAGNIGRIAGTLRVNFKAATGLADFDGEFELTDEISDDNIGIGDDKEKLIDRFNAPTFKSAQDFIVKLYDTGVLGTIPGFDPADLASYYDAAEDQLKFDMSFETDLFNVELPADFSLDLGTLIDVRSDTKLVLSGTGAINLVLGFDFTTDFSGGGSLPGTGNPIDGSTKLVDLTVRPRVEPSITGTSVPSAIGDLAFTVSLTGAGAGTAVVNLPSVDLTAGSDTQVNMINDLVADINAQLAGLNVQVSAETDSTQDNFGQLNFFRSAGAGDYSITVESGDTTDGTSEGDDTDLSIAFLGINGTQTATDSDLLAEREIKQLVGVSASDVILDLTLTGGSGPTDYQVTIAGKNTASIFAGELKAVNRSIIDVVADVKSALADVPLVLGGTDTLDEYINVSFQGSRLVLTLREDAPFTGVTVTSNADALGLDAAQTSNFNDFEVVLDDGTVLSVDISSQLGGGETIDALDIDDVIAAMAAADPNLIVSITADDAATAVDEGGKSLTVSYDFDGVKLSQIRATNGSPVASALGILGTDVNLQDDEDVADGVIVGNNIGGLSFADRFFIEAPSGGSLSDIAELEFSAQAAHLLKDIAIYDGGNIIRSGTVDLRDYVGKTITFSNVNGVADASYEVGAAAALFLDGVAVDGAEGVTLIALGGASATLGEAGQAEITAILESGVNASAALGFVGVDLTGTADFGASISMGLNTNAGPASDQIVTLGEVLEAFREGSGLGVLDFFQLPEVAFREGTSDYGSVDLTLALDTGSDGFNAIADQLLGGSSSVNFGIDLLALGDPFLNTRFAPAGLIVTDADTFTVIGDFTDILTAGQTLRFTYSDGGADFEFDADITSAVFAAGTTTIDIGDLRAVTEGLDVSGTTLQTHELTDVTLRPSVDVDFPEIGALFQDGFGEFGIDEIITALQMLADFLSEFEAFDFMDVNIPVIDRSLGELIGLADDLVDFIEELRANPSENLQFIEDAINDAIGISSATLADVYEAVNGMSPPSPLKAFEIGYDVAEDMLTFTLNLGAGFSEALNIGLSDIGFGPDFFEELGLGDAISFSGSAGLEADGGILMTLALGIDIDEVADFATDGDSTTGVTDAVYLLDTTNLEAVIGASGTNLAFNAGLGPFALAIQNNGSDIAEVNLSAGAELSTDFVGRLSLGEFFSPSDPSDTSTLAERLDANFDIGGANGSASYGTIDGLLPIFFPNDSNYIGAIKLGETALPGRGDLENFGNLVFTTQTPVDGDAGPGEQSVASDALLIDVSELVDYFENFDFSSFSIFDNIRLAVDGFDSFLSLLEVNIFGALSDLELPLVGSSFADASNFIGDFRVDFVGTLRSAIELIEDAAQDFTDDEKNIISNLLFDLLGPDGLNLLLDLDGSALEGDETVGDLIELRSDALAGVLFDGNAISTADIGWNFVIGQNLLPTDLENVNLDFDIGIPGLGLKSEAEIDMMLDWSLAIGFGLSSKEGFYLDVSDDRELEFNASVVPSGSITGQLGFLGLTAETAAGGRDIYAQPGEAVAANEVTGFSATFYMDVFDSINGGADDNTDRLSLTEFAEIGLTFGVDAEAIAVLDLTLGLSADVVGDSVASGFPSIVADLDFYWGIDLVFDLVGDSGNATGSDLGAQLSDGLKYLAFNNVGLDVGELITEVLGPIVDAVAEYTEPLQPFIDFLTAPIPLVDIFGVELTMLELAAQFGDIDTGLIEGIAEIITLVNTVAELRDGGGLDALVIPIGDFVIFDGVGNTDNPFQSGVNSSTIASNRDLSALAGDIDAALNDIINDSGTSDKGKDASKTVQKLKKPGGSFAFPILEDPGQIFGLLMGEPATLVTFDLEPLVVGFEKSFFFSIFGPLGVSLGLQIEFTADFAFGYDTLGISQFVGTDFTNPLLLFNGLYISDTENPDGSGADVPEMTFLGGITAAAELNLGIARAGVAGGLFIEILFDLFDPDNDGKVRITELVNNFVNQTRAPSDAEKLLAPLAIFDVTGEIFARLFAFLKIDFGLFEIDLEFDLVDPITILEFEIDFFRPPVVASEVGNGDLIINVGEFAEQRLLGDNTDFGETVYVERVGSGAVTAGDDITVNVWTNPNGFGSDSPTSSNKFSYTMKAGQNLIIKAGAGNDRIYLQNWDGDEVHFDIEGGAGSDIIEFSGGPAAGGSNTVFNIIDGGAGEDTIVGSSGRDLIIGGAGSDVVSGGWGDDLVVGDQIDTFSTVISINPLGNDGADVVDGDQGDDIVIGGGGSDVVSGGDGDDLIVSDGGEIAFIGTGQKILSNVLALHLDGVTGTDNPGTGVADDVFGGQGDDVIFSGGGNDMVDAGDGDDFVVAGAGFDEIIGGLGSDLIFGDTGKIIQPLLDAAPNSLKANMGSLSNSSHLVNLSKRLAVGPDGSGDTIWGDAKLLGDEDIAAGDNDLIFGAGGNDEIHAGGGDDLVWAGSGADSVFGDHGEDDIRGEVQGDWIDGGSDDDVLNGGSGADIVFGRGGDDSIIINQGGDDLNAGDGNDTYVVNLSGGTTQSIIDIVDSSTLDTDVDVLEVNGTDQVDLFLIRSDTFGQNAFIAGLNGAFNVERINYGKTLERIIVNGGAGDDIFAVDDTAAEMTLNGESGDDQFQIGQLFRTERNVNLEEGGIDTGIDAEDFFLTIEVTRGWLSNGISFPMVVNGGIGNDNFVVYHNKAVLQLNGESGDDIFEVRAFALVGSQEPQRERTDLTGGSGADTVRYAVNAPVNINGGDGFDTLIVIGTEFGDDFVITDNGVFGAGLNVNFVNIESLRVDGAEGDDRFFVQSTLDTVLTELFGGLGNDTFNASGATPPVVSNDLRGHSGLITHDVTSSDIRYDGQTLYGISANVADNEIPFAIITQTQGSTIVDEGDDIGDSYQIVLTRAPQPGRSVFVTIGAPLPSPDQRERGIYYFRLDSAGAVNTLDNGSAVVLEFTSADYDVAQTVNVIAHGIGDDAPARLFTRGDVTPDAPFTFDYDDGAYEGARTGVITHKFSAGENFNFDETDFTAVSTNGDGEVTSMTFNTSLTADAVLGRVVTVSEGGGFGDFRFITGAVDNGGSLTITFDNAWDSNNNPDPAETSFFIRLDDSVVGLVDTVVETKAVEIFNDRSTLTAIKADGVTALDFGAVNSLIGATVELIGGTGAGQQLMILSNTATELTLNGIWNIDPAGDTIFRIEQYDGLNSQVVEVLVNDNDTPGLIVDQTVALDGSGNVIAGDDTITAVIEGSDADRTGEADALNLRLTTDLSIGQEVTVSLIYDATQLKLTSTADPNAAALTEVIFDNTTNGGMDLYVYAVNDIAREGAHTSQISFAFAPNFGDAAETPVTDSFTVDLEDVAPVSSIGTNFLPAAITSVVDDGVTLTQGEDYILIPDSNKILFIRDGDEDDPIERSGIIEIEYTHVVPTYHTAFAQNVLVRISDDDAPTVLVRESGGSTDVIEGGLTDSYEILLTGELTGADTVNVDLTEIITKTTQTGGIRHDLTQVQITRLLQDGVVIYDANSLNPALNSDLVSISTDASGNDIIDSGGNTVTKVSVSFDASNWDSPITVEVAAVDDLVADGGDTKVFAPGPETLAQILGPIVVDGAGGNGSLSGLAGPLMLPGELNIKPATGDVLTIDNADDGAVLTVNRSDITTDLLEDLRVYVDGDAPGSIGPIDDLRISALVGKTIEITAAPNAPSTQDQFRLILDIDFDVSTVTFYLNDAFTLATNELGDVIEDFDVLPSYAITSESLNFFVNEDDSVDVLFVHDGDSPADSSGTLTSNRLFGLNMGPDTVIGERARQGGITFGELEVLDITLGSGYNDFTVIGTPTNTLGGSTQTILRTGTEVPYAPLGDPGDTVNVLLNAADAVLQTGSGYEGNNPESGNGYQTEVLLTGADLSSDLTGQLLRLYDDIGELTAERWIVGQTATLLLLDQPLEALSFVNHDWEIVDPVDGNFAVDLQGGNDTLDATGSTRGMVVFGGAGNDTITTGSGDDIVFGDIGRVDYRDATNAIVTRLGHAPEVILGSAIAPFGDLSELVTDQTIFPVRDLSTGAQDDPFETGLTGLVGLYVDVNNGTGALQEPRLITGNTASVLSVDPAFQVELDATSDFRISTVPEDQSDGIFWGPSIIVAIADALGGDDIINTGAGDDVAMGGEGSDDITLGTADATQDDDIGFGDLGMVRLDFLTGAVILPIAGETVQTYRDGVYSIELATGGDDTIRGNAGSDLIIGGIGSDTLYGDDETASAGANDGDDIVLGDAGFVDYEDEIISRVETYRTNGAGDIMTGSAGSDIMLGGLGGDQMWGDAANAAPGIDGDDIMFGDHGAVIYDVFTSEASGPATLSTLASLVGVTETFAGADSIRGNAGADIILGGTDSDILDGDDQAGSAGNLDGDDILIGDTGMITFNTALMTSQLSRIETTDVSDATGGNDTIRGRGGNDRVLGGVGSDTLHGDAGDADLGAGDSSIDGDDIIIGDNGALDYGLETTPDFATLDRIMSFEDSLGAGDMISGNAANDLIIGGYGGDTIDGNGAGNLSAADDGDDVVIGDNGAINLIGGQFDTIRTGDTFATFASDDTIIGTAGSDILLGGLGADIIHGSTRDGDLTPTDATLDGDDILLGDNGMLSFGLDAVPDRTTLDRFESFEDGQGAGDTISGNAANDLIIGGYGGDTIDGNGAGNLSAADDGDDVVIGDNGEMNLEGGNFTKITTHDASGTFAANDTITGASGSDYILGGLGADLIDGDHHAGFTTVNDAADIILGDNGELIFDEDSAFNAGTAIFDQDVVPARDLSTLDIVRTLQTDQGGNDTITGSIGDDLILGGFGGDRINGGTDNDIVLGDFGRVEFLNNQARYLTTTDKFEGGNDTIFGDENEDLLIGGAGADRIDGDGQRDMIFGDNVILDRIAGFGDLTDPRFRTMSSTQIYGDGVDTGAEGEALVNLDANRDHSGSTAWQDWDVIWLDHDSATDTAGLNNFGDDYIAGGGDQDVIFGQLGDDTIQGDGSIDSLVDLGIAYDALRLPDGSLSVTASFEALTDGDDYIEGNGGSDVIFGNLGQDDIIGDNSDLYSLDTLDQRTPVGGDMIFGGAGIRIERNEYIEDRNGDGTVDTTDIALADRHSRDSDMILGDNGRIFRLVSLDGAVGGTTSALSFVYDGLDDNATEHYDAMGRGAERIEVRAADLIDYTLGGNDIDPANTVNDRGEADEIHGESGDDFIYGMVGNDAIFGGSEDDDIIGGYGSEWISGGTGQDGVIGGDGRIWTSKNTSDANETEVLYGIGTVDVNQFISTPGKIQQAVIHTDNALKKTVDLTPFYPDGADQFTKIEDNSLYDNDIIFGGLGSDFLHGGFGSDAISGAEAMAGDISFELDGVEYDYTMLPLSYDNPGNPGDYLAYGQAAGRTTEFAAYDEFNPRPLVFVAHETPGDITSPLVFVDPALRADAVPFVLNFSAQDGAETDTSMQSDGLPSDGDDVIFGDLGNDWLVGGTGKDHLYGGFGDDLLDADDDRSTDSGTNQTPDTADSYADIAHGGGGRDVLIGNTGGDRLIDWVGEFNSYIVPFAPFGAFTISRNVQPQIFDYLYDLSAADGADPTRIVDSLDDSRNGEPYGEIGAVKQQDPFWQDQTGAPDDPQPGNIPGGKRDVMAAEDFNTPTGGNGNGNNGGGNGNNLLGFAADSGQWNTTGGSLYIEPDMVGQDAVSVFHLQQYLPVYFEMVADVIAVKDRAGYDSNAFMIFDYQGPENFKFAGINQDINKLQIGHRDASGWQVDTQNNMRLRADKAYNLLVAVNGTTVTALVDGKNFLTHTFDARMEDGIAQPISKGMIGFGADNSRTYVDNFAVQVLPANLTYENNEDFDDGFAQYFSGLNSGTWTTTNDAFTGFGDNGELAFNLLDMAADANLAAGTLALNANAKVRFATDVTTTGQGGLIFDFVSEDRFKFAMVDVAGDRILVGHVDAQHGIVIDAQVSVDLTSGDTYNLAVILAGSTVSVQIDEAFVLSHSFNGVSVDGQFGLVANNGAATFDDVSFGTDDPSLGLPTGNLLRASSTGTSGENVSTQDVSTILNAAIGRMIELEDLTAQQAAYLYSLDFQIADLDGDALAMTQGDMITFDINAAGFGYFIDETADEDEEFKADGTAIAGSDADGRIDLMTVALHELGHALGFDHASESLSDDYMGGVLDPSQRLGLSETDNVTQLPSPSGFEPATPAETPATEALVFDERVGGMITMEEALLLDALGETEVTPQETRANGKGRAVKWAAE